eukprot:CAMPEP_0173413566 /NCGR_PEP_ID=MMETSP1356-20130122/82387_1 /TAXON_ID=77927 ORGANISM="Hemiselmis virescens, Strain PCC157" /NCGR_SAMPLE_ID=MMETSP1356 /ASSEMBLY_ACC=CAM_ASM_000847 /LENGTH=39 /DNA_ID= /DNA_START= /DNA_END= /DNA_ORIENTATION=
MRTTPSSDKIETAAVADPFACTSTSSLPTLSKVHGIVRM